MQICIVFMLLCYILMQKEWHFHLKKMRYQNTLTLPLYGRNCVFEDLKVQNFPGEGSPRTPYIGGGPLPLTPPPALLKTWICPKD